MLYIVDLRTIYFLLFADPIIFCGLKTSAIPQIHNRSPYVRSRTTFDIFYMAFRGLKYTYIGKKKY
jgi:hypothetical protein